MKDRGWKESVFILLSLFMLPFLACCADRPGIVGKWQEVGKTATIEFSADGTFKAIDNQGMAVSGRYTLLGREDIRCEIQHKGKSEEIVNLKISVKRDELTLTSKDDPNVERYRREK